MSARDRAEARDRAAHNGRMAYRDGKKKTDNPYKDGPWSNGPSWSMGWDEEWAKDGAPEDRLGF